MFKGEITIANSTKIQKSIVAMYDLELENIKAEDTRVTLANIMYNRDLTEVNAIKIAYHLSTITDQMAQAEGFKNATQMIMDITGLKKSMISNYVKVARAYFWDDNHDFYCPDCLQGFTITQLAQGMEKVGSVQFMEDIMSGSITPDMSVKKIRDFYNDAAAIETTATESTATESTATESTATESTATESTEPTEKKVNPKDAGVFPVYELLDSTGQVVGMASINKDYDKEGLNKYLKTLTLGKKVG